MTVGAYTTTDLINAIKRTAMIPINQSTFENSDLLALADDELHLGLLPLIMSVREEYYVTSKDFDSGSTIYEIPTRAIGGKLRDIVLVGSDGTERNIPQIDPFASEYYGSSGNSPAFFLRNNKVVFTSAPSDTVRMYYFLRPGKLIPVTDAALITSIDTGTGDIEVSAVPTDFSTSTPIDFLKAGPGYDTFSMDVEISSIASTTISFSPSSLPSDLSIGDYITLAGESPIPQIPREYQSILAQRVAVKVLEALGQHDSMQLSQQKLDRMESAAFGLIEPRVDGANKKIINRNSSLRKWYFGRWYHQR